MKKNLLKKRLQELAGIKPNLITEQLTPMDWLSGENVDTSVLNSIGLNVQEINIYIEPEACNGTPYYIGATTAVNPSDIFLNFTVNNMMQAPANTPLGCLYFAYMQDFSITFYDVEPNAQNFNVTNINEIPAIINQFGNNNDWGGNLEINGFRSHQVVNAQIPGQALEITNTVTQQFLDDMGTEINPNQSCPYWNQYLNSGNVYYFNLCWFDYFSDEHQTPAGIMGSINFGINGFFTETEMPEDTDIDDLDPGLTDDEADFEGGTVDDIDDIDNIIDPGTIDPPKDVDPVFPFGDDDEEDNTIDPPKDVDPVFPSGDDDIDDFDPGTIDPPKDVDPVFPSGDDDIDDFDPGTIDPPKDTDPVRPFGDDDEEEDDDTDFPDDGGTTVDDFDLEAFTCPTCPPGEICGCTNPEADNYNPNATYDPLLYMDNGGFYFPDWFYINDDPGYINISGCDYPFGEIDPNSLINAGSCEFSEFACNDVTQLDAWLNVFWMIESENSCPPGYNCGYTAFCNACAMYGPNFMDADELSSYTTGGGYEQLGSILANIDMTLLQSEMGWGSVEEACECCEELGIGYYDEPPDIFNDVFYGCTDENAINYSPTANVDNGSCIYECSDFGYPGYYNIPCKSIDQDNDGIANDVDDDVDGDGIPNEEDPDIDGDDIPNDIDDTPLGPINTFSFDDYPDLPDNNIDGAAQGTPVIPDDTKNIFLKMIKDKLSKKSRLRERLQKLANIKNKQ